MVVRSRDLTLLFSRAFFFRVLESGFFFSLLQEEQNEVRVLEG